MSAEKNIFEKYEDAVKKHVNGLSKTAAIQWCSQPSSRLMSPATIQELYESMMCHGWEKQTGTNWIWRYKAPGNTKSQEVSLERAVAILDKNLWACQMSTSSGVEAGVKGLPLHRRRAIDLVRYVGPRQYAFVELKVGSNNPLYAVFEILGYALAYIHARVNKWRGDGEHNLFDAERIELTILGPNTWYDYAKRGIARRFDEDLNWLTEEISESLNDFVREKFSGALTFSMNFREFSGDSPNLQAQDIHRGAMNWRIV